MVLRRDEVERVKAELTVLEPVDTAIGQPDVTGAVFDDRVEGLSHQAILFGISADDLRRHAHQAIVESAQPEHALAIFINYPNVAAGESLRGGEATEPVVLEPQQPA